VLLRHAPSRRPSRTAVSATDVTEPESVGDALRDIRSQYGPIGALLHLIPLREDLQRETGDLTGWRKSARLAVRSLYLLARAALAILKTRGDRAAHTILASQREVVNSGSDGTSCRPRRFNSRWAISSRRWRRMLPMWSAGLSMWTAEPAAILNQKVFDEFTSLDTTLQAGRPGDGV